MYKVRKCKFQPKTKTYQILDQDKLDFSHSQCPGFTDLKLNPKKKQMTSSCHGGAKWWTDTYQFKHGHWKWIKSNGEPK